MPILLLQGATEAARVRASPRNPEYIGPPSPLLATPILLGPCAACLNVPVLVLLEALQEMLLAQGQHHDEEGVTFLFHRHLVSSSPSASPHEVPMCLYLPAPPLVYIGPLDSVREPVVVINALK